jgi:hypothetical protein
MIHLYAASVRYRTVIQLRKDGLQDLLLTYGPANGLATLANPDETILCLDKLKVKLTAL